jgi:transposase
VWRERWTKKNALGRSRGGVSTKIHAVTDTQGRPLHVEVTPGQQHDVTMAETLLDHVRGKAFIADTGYDSNKVIGAVVAKGLEPVIPSNPSRRAPLPLNKALYNLRYRVECFFHSLKRFRRAATRYEKTARNYLAFLHAACAMIWLA